jgi:hypothetical protein
MVTWQPGIIFGGYLVGCQHLWNRTLELSQWNLGDLHVVVDLDLREGLNLFGGETKGDVARVVT